MEEMNNCGVYTENGVKTQIHLSCEEHLLFALALFVSLSMKD